MVHLEWVGKLMTYALFKNMNCGESIAEDSTTSSWFTPRPLRPPRAKVFTELRYHYRVDATKKGPGIRAPLTSDLTSRSYCTTFGDFFPAFLT